jgi:hypothetical protein
MERVKLKGRGYGDAKQTDSYAGNEYIHSLEEASQAVIRMIMIVKH